MDPSPELTIAAFQSLSTHVAILDRDANIVCWNQAWDDFGSANGAHRTIDWRRYNYRDVCLMAADDGDDFALLIADTLSQTLRGRQGRRTFEYPCHGPTEERYFEMTITPLEHRGERFAIIEHDDITQHRLRRELEPVG
ncbi:MAG: hypothetical protein AAGA37_13925 [Actinomycetota bacterium]